MKKLSNKQCIQKWKPVLESAQINEDGYSKVAEYCEKLSKMDGFITSGDKNLHMDSLVCSLKVFSKIDMNKVMFTSVRDICKMNHVQMAISRDQIHDLKFQLGLNIIEMVESKIINEFIQSIEKMIKNDGGIIIQQLFSKTEMVDKGKNNVIIRSESWLQTFNVYRYMKLKKVRQLIDDKK